MKWRKLGIVYVPDGHLPWAKSHAMAPTPILLDERCLRVFFASCDEQMVSRVGYVDLDPRRPATVMQIASHPVLDVGEPGCFDDNGVNVTSVIRVQDELWMYYFGYQLSVRVRYLLFSGLAVSRDGGESFQRVSEVPILDRTPSERFIRSAPTVIKDQHGRFRAWYASGDEFIDVNGKLLPRYGISYLESDDGRSWSGTGEPILVPQGDDEFGFGRPFITRWGGGYRLWYSLRFRSKGYRIGFADSADGRQWLRRDSEVGIDVSSTGWDAESICYASLVALNSRVLMFYNGNDYGRTGFGMAELESD